LHVPVFATFQVFTKSSFGLNTVPLGTVTSRTKARLLHPKARESGLTVGVGIVPVTVGEWKGVIVARVGRYMIRVEVCIIVVG
jgi:hypothetical protein